MGSLKNTLIYFLKAKVNQKSIDFWCGQQNICSKFPWVWEKNMIHFSIIEKIRNYGEGAILFKQISLEILKKETASELST